MNKKRILEELIFQYNLKDIQYCFLRNYNKINIENDGDIDIFIDKSSKNTNLLLINNVIKKYNMILIKNFEFNDNIIYTIYFINENSNIEVIHFHFHFALRINQISININNRIYLKSKNIIKNRNNFLGVYTLDNLYIAYILIIHSIFDKGYFKKEYQDFLVDYLSFDNLIDIEKIFNENFPGWYDDDLFNMLLNSQFEEIIEIKKKLFKIRTKFSLLLLFILKWIKRFLGILKRIIFRRGKFVVFLGPDGVGKTTISKEILAVNNFKRKKYLYLGNSNIVKSKIKLKSQKDKYNRNIFRFGIFKPFLRTLYFSIIYIKLYYTKIYPLLLKDYIIFGDRYFYDLLVISDINKRNCIYKIFVFFVPKPDIIILLDADTKNIYERKKELSVKEINNQLDKYKFFLKSVKSTKIIDNNNEKPISKINKIIYNTL